MPAATPLNDALDRQLLIQLGQRLREARKAQGMTTTQLAERAGIARMTLAAVEAGAPSPTMGTYVRVMSALGVSGDLVMLASGESLNHPSPPTTRVQAKAVKQDVQDLQSLLLHNEAIALLKKSPALISRAQATLEKWRAKGNASSKVLWDEWSVILHRRDWRRALARTRRSNELRQASPLPVLLPPETRARVLEQIRELKAGIDLAGASSGRRRAVGTP